MYCCTPAGGELLVSPETAAAYETGHGSVVLRATAHVEYEDSKRKKKRTPSSSSAQDAAAAEADAAAAAAGGKALIVFTEMPYQVCKVGTKSLWLGLDIVPTSCCSWVCCVLFGSVCYT
jgi:DNA gyrase/topoisomerase IV subunit A